MKTQSADTRFETEEFLLSLLRNADTKKKFSQIRSLSQTTLQLSRRAIARANPKLSEKQINLLFVSYHYGTDIARRLENYLKRFDK